MSMLLAPGKEAAAEKPAEAADALADDAAVAEKPAEETPADDAAA